MYHYIYIYILLLDATENNLPIERLISVEFITGVVEVVVAITTVSVKSIESVKATLPLKPQMPLAIIAITIKPVNTAIASALFYRLVFSQPEY